MYCCTAAVASKKEGNEGDMYGVGGEGEARLALLLTPQAQPHLLVGACGTLAFFSCGLELIECLPYRPVAQRLRVLLYPTWRQPWGCLILKALSKDSSCAIPLY